MWGYDSKLHKADVVAVFDNQDDAEEAVLQLRLSGFRDSQIGYFAQQPAGGLTDLIEHDREFSGSIIGGIVGALLGVGAAYLVDRWTAASMDFSDLLGLAITLATFGALFLGFIGWGIGLGIARRAVAVPAIDPSAGPYIVAVEAGEAREQIWSMIHEYGGHELPPGAMTAHPATV